MAAPVRGFQRLAGATVALTLLLVALGGAVRATGSGLACPDWPFCYGKVVPRQADIPPETGYTLWNVWLEHTHRLTASVVGLLVLALAVWAVARFRRQPTVLWSAVAALALVTVQAGLGAAVVLRALQAELVTAHLGMAMVVVALLLFLTLAAPRPPGGQRAEGDRRFVRASAAVAGVALTQILVGGHVTGIAAGLVYTDFPLLGEARHAAPTVAQQAYHITHRTLAFVLLGAVVYLCARAVRHRRDRVAAGRWRHEHRWLVKLPMWAATLVVVQIGLGVANLRLGAPPPVVTAHLAVASWIWALLAAHTVLAYRRAPAGAATAPRDREAVA